MVSFDSTVRTDLMLPKEKPKKQAKLNVQGLARRDKGFMSNILSEEGHTTISIDLGAGEPTVTAHYSQDPNYMYACFGGVGKTPYYDGPTLMIDDIYLMVMSRSPVGRDIMREVFNTKWGTLTFSEQWLEDPEVIKGEIKTHRALHKILALGIGYGMGPKKMVKQAYDNAYIISFQEAKAFHSEYWSLFSGVKNLADRLSFQIRRDKKIINPFGYRLVPEPHKAFNYFIQSTVSGIMHVFAMKLHAISPYAKFITCIHDELLEDIPDDKLDLFRKHKDMATDSLNKDLGWSVNIRTGFEIGKNWYEAK